MASEYASSPELQPATPHLERRVRAQQRHHLFAQRPEVRWVSEHLAHLHGEMIEERRKDLGLAHHAILQLRDALAPKPAERRPQAPPQRGWRIPAKIVVVEMIDGVDQQMELDIEFPVGRGHAGAYFGIHTRTSDKSRSTSSGFAM